MQEAEGKIVKWLQQQAEAANAKGLVFGLSGGVDSSVVAVLCKKAFPDSSLALMMPCSSSDTDLAHAKLVAEKFGISHRVIDLGRAFECISSDLGKAASGSAGSDGIALANIKPRLRMVSLYYFANRLNWLVVGTDNKTEAMVGYFTKFGDGGVDILPIAGLFKRDVRKLAAHLGIPQEIIEKPPSAGLWPEQTDEGEMGISYEVLDGILEKIEGGKRAGIDPALLKKVESMVAGSEHKRKPAPSCEVGEVEE